MSTTDHSVTKKGFRQYFSKTFLIGLGFFTIGLMNPLYDTYVPIFLKQYISKYVVIGGIMTLDNVLAIFLIPIITAWSDRTRTGIGRRMPFILATVPLAAITFGLLPYAAGLSLSALVILLFFHNLFRQTGYGPVVALMPDIVPGEYRSEANGVINTMGGLAAIIGTLGLARLMDVDLVLPVLGATKDRLPFPVAAALIIAAILLLFLRIKEPRHKNDDAGDKKVPGILKSIGIVFGGKDKSAVLILVSLFFWFLAYQGILPFLGDYTVTYLGVGKGLAAYSAGAVGVAYMLFAIFSGYIAHRIGRKRVIRISLVVIAGLLGLMFLHHPVTSALGISGIPAFAIFLGILFFFGMFWVSVVTNSFPMLWQMASYSDIGIYTGLYYTFSQGAAIIAPFIYGGVIDLFGHRGIFVTAAICMLGAFVTMAFVTKGEVAGHTDEDLKGVDV